MAPVHLLVLIHGMWGNPTHLAELDRVVRETHAKPSADGVTLHVLLASANRDDSTYDGIDWGGERVAKELAAEVEKIESKGDKVTRFSVTGYSLGGLVARYLVGILHQQGFFENVEPVNFNTIATPHIGLPRYPSFFSALFSLLGPRLLSRTGEQFYCGDKWSPNGRPLLIVMADPDRIFYKALTLFKQIRIYASVINDTTVPYLTAAIETHDPFVDYKTSGMTFECDSEYPPLVTKYSLPSTPPPIPPKPTVLTPDWFRTFKSDRPILPPFLQYRFPLNLVLYASLPLLIPMAITFVIIRLSLASRSSRARIQALETEHSSQHSLITILSQMEREMEDAVVDLIDSDDPEPSPSGSASKTDSSTARPILSPQQIKMAKWLNTLPIKKELAYFPAVRNAHAMIVCRDVKRFEIHRRGEPVLRHFADSFIL